MSGSGHRDHRNAASRNLVRLAGVALAVALLHLSARALAQGGASPLPSALPAAPSAAPAPPALPSAAPATPPASSGAASSQPSPPPAGAPGSASPPREPEDSNVVLYGEQKPQADESGVPATVPHELRRNVKPGSKVAVEDTGGQAPLTIEEIYSQPVFSASSHAETALSAPAWVITITGQQLRERGYTDLSQLLDDLPGMDVVRPYGSTYAKSYWRGYRGGTGADPYLLMLDGVVMNSLYNDTTQILAAFPLSDVDHVEIVYGPASVLYGANAARGIINVVTRDGAQRQAKGDYGISSESHITYGGPQRNLSSFGDSTKLVDGNVLYTTKDFRLRVTTHIESGVLDRSLGDQFEYAKPQYYSDPRIWGAPVLQTYPDLAGAFRSVDEKRAVDLRFYAAGFEVGAQYFALETGQGTLLAADRFQTETPWTSDEMSLYVRRTTRLSPSATSTSLVQYRKSDVVSPSTLLMRRRANGTIFDDPGPTLLSIEAPNWGLVAQQDFDIDAARNLLMQGDQLGIGFGLKFQHLELSRAPEVVTDITYPVADPDPIGHAINTTDPAAVSNDGRFTTSDDVIGTYLEGIYTFLGTQSVHLGGRFDHSTLVGDNDVTFRGGYVGGFGPVTAKLLYGQATYEPSVYDLGEAKADGLPPPEDERSQTLEANVELALDPVALHADAYFINDKNPIVYGKNLSDRNVAGGDLGAQLALRWLQVWAYYSRFFVAQQSGGAAGGAAQPIGDLAFDKIWAGATAHAGVLSATLLGRWMGPRDPVATNPLGTVPSYWVADANVIVSHVLYEGLWFGFRVSNLFDYRYSQPGMVTAGSGAAPGYFAGTQYFGSRDDYNSRLPQPGRGFYLTAGFDR